MLETWFEQSSPALSPSTNATNRIILDRHLIPYLGKVPLSKLTAAKIDALYRMLSTKGREGGRPLLPATVHRTHNVLHRALGQAVKWGWLTDHGTLAALGAHREAAAAVATAIDAERESTSYVFSSTPDGATPWRPDYATHVFARLVRNSGTQKIRLHDLRHFVATRLLANGVDVRTVAGRLGHKNPNVTLNVYAAFLSEIDRQAANILGDLLKR